MAIVPETSESETECLRRWEGRLLPVGEGRGEREEVAPASREGNTFTPIIQSQLRERAKETRVTEGISER